MAASKDSAIVGFGDLYDRMVVDRPFVTSLLSGHLAIEFLLRRLVRQRDPTLTKRADTSNHFALIVLNHKLGIISEAQRDVLIEINKERNKFAHEISYEPSIVEMRELWRRASKAFSDMTDGISQGIEALDTASALSGIEDWILPELFIQICYDLHNEYTDRGGDIETF